MTPTEIVDLNSRRLRTPEIARVEAMNAHPAGRARPRTGIEEIESTVRGLNDKGSVVTRFRGRR